jgi:RNA polymerase sigma-70 factor (ECF subfamily)
MSGLPRNGPSDRPAGERNPDDDLDDASLVTLAKEDRRAFAPLYRRYVDPVYRYCDRCLGDAEAAEDATSLIFAKALAALPTCRPATFRSWLFAIAHNAITDAYRGRSPTRSLDAAERVADESPSPEARILAEDDALTLRSLLARLPPDQRDLLELRLAGLTDAEIARALGRSHGAVRRSQYRAIARLRVLIGPAIQPSRPSRPSPPKEGRHVER